MPKQRIRAVVAMMVLVSAVLFLQTSGGGGVASSGGDVAAGEGDVASDRRTESFHCMGTLFEITVSTPGDSTAAAAGPAIDRAFETVARLDTLLSTYKSFLSETSVILPADSVSMHLNMSVIYPPIFLVFHNDLDSILSAERSILRNVISKSSGQHFTAMGVIGLKSAGKNADICNDCL